MTAPYTPATQLAVARKVRDELYAHDVEMLDTFGTKLGAGRPPITREDLLVLLAHLGADREPAAPGTCADETDLWGLWTRCSLAPGHDGRHANRFGLHWIDR